MQSPLKSLQIVHMALITGVTMAYIVIGQINSLEFFNISKLNNTSLLVVLGVVMVALISNLIYNQVLMQISKTATNQEQFAKYQTANIIRLAILEGTALLILFLQNDVLFMGLLLIVYMILLRPTENRMKHDLNKSRFL
jgi:DMSO reductase anchor subunit